MLGDWGMRCLFCGYDNAESGGAVIGAVRFLWQWDWRCSCGYCWDGEYSGSKLTYGFGTKPNKNRVEVPEGCMVVFGSEAEL